MRPYRVCFRFLVLAGVATAGCSPSVPSGGGSTAEPTDESDGTEEVAPTDESNGTEEPAPTDESGGTEAAAGDIYVDVYDPDQACNGTTLLPDLHDPDAPRIIEVDMQGEIVWEYAIPDDLKQYRDPGMDVERLPNDNILFVAPRHGIYEIDRDGAVVWSHLDDEVSHDADRLPNANTLYVWGGGDKLSDAQAKEVSPDGELVWSWHARDEFNVEPYSDIYRDGWTHANAVTRLDNGNTLVSLRNFNLTVEVDAAGVVVWEFDWTSLDGEDPHEPEILPDDRLLICLQGDTPHQVVEIDRASGELAWEYYQAGLRTARDADRLPNGNTLIQAVQGDGDVSVVFEVTPAGEIVWQLKLKDTPAERSPGWFYKAQRVCQE